MENQGGDISYLEDLEKFEKASVIEPVYSEHIGYICEIDAKKVGKLACHLGAGRIQKEDVIDTKVGIVLAKKVKDSVKKGEVLGYIHAKDKESASYAKQKLMDIIKVGEEPVQDVFKILGVIR